jgi:epoxyqueuosine reductase
VIATSTPPTAIDALTPELQHRLEAQAYGLGFDLVGFAELGPVESAPHFERWLAEGRAGEMHYLAKWADKRRDTRLPYAGVASAVVVAMDYGGREPSGPVARYARGDDYHDVMRDRLDALHAWLQAELGHAIPGRAYVDTGPILERDLARRAGLGWFGKNTMLIHPTKGSFFFLGALLLGVAVTPSAPFEADRCGTCTRCIEACPTDAIMESRSLDATRCISYLTIEQRGEIPVALRERMGGLVYGCDICQEVCPWNVRFASSLREPAYAPREALRGKDARALARELLAMSQEEFSRAFSKSPMKRAKLRGLKRNAAVVLGNASLRPGQAALAEDVATLVAALADPEPLVRRHAAWALARTGSPGAREALRAAESSESDISVLDEIRSGFSSRQH